MRHLLINKLYAISTILTLILTAFPQYSLANNLNLSFSDLTSGPDTGLSDGKGSGTIITVWGQGLGNSQKLNKVYFTDSAGIKREASHIYYWKNANGILPSGPANLFDSHQMQEIAFSIPDGKDGLGTISVNVNGIESNTLPFTVRPGNIYHVKNSGSDSENGSWSKPWLTVDKASESAPAGSTIYIHDITVGDINTDRGIYWNNSNSSSNLEAQFSYVAYPGYQPKVFGQRGVSGYNTAGMVVSKLDIYSSNHSSTDANDQPSGTSNSSSDVTFGIFSTKNGRAIANRIGDFPLGCSSGTHAAIYGNATFQDYVSNYKILGNEVYEYGCSGSSKLHHTTYLTVRSKGKNLQVEPWEFGYNYLHDNKAKLGIHQFDQDDGCGDLTGPLRIYNNVIINQAGAGISVGSQCGWTMDSEIENNVLINVGLPAAWDGINPNSSDGAQSGGISIMDSGLTGTMRIKNNLIFNWNRDNVLDSGEGCLSFFGRNGDSVSVEWINNICITEHDQPFMAAGYQADVKYDNVTGTSNIWYDTSNTTNNDNIPNGLTNSIKDNPKITIKGALVIIEQTSPAVNTGFNHSISRDVYGYTRDTKLDIGPAEFINKSYSTAKPPNNFITIQK